LHKLIKELVLSYNTYEKATFDQYLIASIVLNSKNSSEAYQLIDDISGDGSLNAHFKRMYQDTISLNDDVIKSVLDNSLYPIIKFEKIPYEYYPLLNSSLFQNTMHQGDIEVQHDFALALIPVNGTYLSSSVNMINQKDEEDNYNVIFENDTIQIELRKNKFKSISEETLKSCLKTDLRSIEEYKGIVVSNVTNGNWNQLNNSLLNNLISATNYYIEDGNHYTITNEGVRKTIIANYFGVFIYQEEVLGYNYKNKDICEKVIQTLMNNSKINEFKTKALVSVLRNVNPDMAIDGINYILQRKESKELSEFGINLAERGFERGWNIDSIKSFRKFTYQPNHLVLVYRLDSKLDYTVDELLRIYKADKSVLNREHLTLIEEHSKNRNEKISYIQRMMGEITSSGIREKNRRFSGREFDDFRKAYNKLLGHNDDINEYSDEKLDNHEQKMIKLYNDYLKLKHYIESEGGL